MERIDRRMPIKVIAQELGVSETRINQHIRILKDIYQVASLNELVEVYRHGRAESEGEPRDLSESAYIKNQIPWISVDGDNRRRADPGEIMISDVLPLKGALPWETVIEPRIVPGVLDGENAGLLRLASIVGIAFGILAAVVLIMTAAVTLSEALDGVAYIPVDQNDTG
ncbi:MAG: hypothetical protein APF82_08295 [Sphingomonadales bacterium BRH_c42]|nr:MAG: hypothetical protein APF82_08295 [Sphingomonadales bacterium BRH_c42]